MVRALEEEKENYKLRLGHFKAMHENEGRHTRSMTEEYNASLSPMDHDRMTSRSHASASLHDQNSEQPKIGWTLNRSETIKSRFSNDGSVGGGSPRARDRQSSDMELMKEKFAKLLLGEDMSGGGKGVSSALALSNAITNLAASVFGEQKKLEPMSDDNKVRWRKEIDWLLSVTDHIVELVPSKQKAKDGTNMDIMVTKQRTDLQMNIPALRKLDAMLLDCLENFKDQNEFYYTKSDDDESKGKSGRKNDKWWIPTPKVPPDGLSEVTRKWLQFQKDSVNQVLKAAMAINAQVLSEMEIPQSYIETLPKNGRASLGDVIYKSITDDQFGPDSLLSSLDLSSEHKILDLKNKIEASVVIWKKKMNDKNSKSSWSSAVSLEKREILEDRAETILLILKHRFPGLPQSSLDITKIQDNRDVGQAILESYSRIIESLAFTVMSRIDDVMQADTFARDSSTTGQKMFCAKEPSPTTGYEKSPNAKEEQKSTNLSESPNAMTLLDFMGWNLEQGETDTRKELQDDIATNVDTKILVKPLPNVSTKKKLSYIERLENLGGSRSPTARH